MKRQKAIRIPSDHVNFFVREHLRLREDFPFQDIGSDDNKTAYLYQTTMNPELFIVDFRIFVEKNKQMKQKEYSVDLFLNWYAFESGDFSWVKEREHARKNL